MGSTHGQHTHDASCIYLVYAYIVLRWVATRLANRDERCVSQCLRPLSLQQFDQLRDYCFHWSNKTHATVICAMHVVVIDKHENAQSHHRDTCCRVCFMLAVLAFGAQCLGSDDLPIYQWHAIVLAFGAPWQKRQDYRLVRDMLYFSPSEHADRNHSITDLSMACYLSRMRSTVSQTTGLQSYLELIKLCRL